MTSNGSSNSLSAASAFMRDLPSSSNLCSQLKPAAERPKAPLPTVYYAKHQFTEPPPHQVVETDKTNILLRQFHQLAEAKRERQKRLPTDSQLASEKPAKTSKAAPCDASSSTF
uniref:DET1- and DDB1-associated protein 1 domain-containing protein n=1 Tax=Chrysotila carterae TaxID=13221 RepID=A0A7S4C263_CHRCT|mmetsp:Transcript_59758/g.129511  ORF Transcript_59758/g.129511 Transcript_59758/m.129511 type:complete len:114 (-) Transcript_59758:287-628(-)